MMSSQLSKTRFERQLARPDFATGPVPDQTVLLADAGLVPEPERDRLALRHVVESGLQHRRDEYMNWFSAEPCARCDVVEESAIQLVREAGISVAGSRKQRKLNIAASKSLRLFERMA